jgi:hypothetical protein
VFVPVDVEPIGESDPVGALPEGVIPSPMSGEQPTAISDNPASASQPGLVFMSNSHFIDVCFLETRD